MLSGVLSKKMRLPTKQTMGCQYEDCWLLIIEGFFLSIIECVLFKEMNIESYCLPSKFFFVLLAIIIIIFLSCWLLLLFIIIIFCIVNKHEQLLKITKIF